MSNPIVYLVVVTAAFLLAGLVKGVTGLALPTVGVGLLSLAVPPAYAAALIVVPALMTNVWKMMSGPRLGSVGRRLWPMQLAICLGTWAGASLIAGSETAFASAALGIALIAYAAFGLMNVRVPHVLAWAEWWLGTFVGGAMGFITAATGVFAVPAVPYLQALSFEREEFMRAVGLSFTVSTIALAWSLVGAGTLNLGTGLYSLLALVPALAGMIAGQHLLRVMRFEIFRRWFFSGLTLLGLRLAIGVLWRAMPFPKGFAHRQDNVGAREFLSAFEQSIGLHRHYAAKAESLGPWRTALQKFALEIAREDRLRRVGRLDWCTTISRVPDFPAQNQKPARERAELIVRDLITGRRTN